jgi:general secretion pathway protein L
MPTLILPLPDAPPADAWDWLLVDDAGTPLRQGANAPAQWPPAERVVLALPPARLTWLRTTLPPTAAKRWRAALPGLLEDALLDDPEQLMLALPDDARGGADTWVAATPLAPLQAAVAAAEASGRRVDAIAPTAWPLAPGDTPQAHAIDHAGQARLLWRDAEGVALLPLAGGFARQRVGDTAADWTAEPAAVAAAEAWRGQPVAVRSTAQAWADAARSPWNLRQGPLTPQLRGLHALQHLGHRLLQPEWRAWRWGLAALVAVQLVGLNLLALQQHRAERQRALALQAVAQAHFPGWSGDLGRVERQLTAWRRAAGVSGPGDLESLMGAAARHWPAGAPPVQAIDFEGERLTLSAPGWLDDWTPAFGQALAADGVALQQDGPRLVLQARGSTP